jgi:hypothetical protein|tara:strand:- start:46 stop:219 length:174 start_codon:yes stop_codon:yes gene_type:complete
MNPTKWKSVVVSIGAYTTLKSLAVSNHRTISGQLTYILENYVRDNPSGDGNETRNKA